MNVLQSQDPDQARQLQQLRHRPVSSQVFRTQSSQSSGPSVSAEPYPVIKNAEDAAAIRSISDWGSGKRDPTEDPLDSKFNRIAFLSNVDKRNLKFRELAEAIRIRDQQDYLTHGTYFKHVIFVRDKERGSVTTAMALRAYGFKIFKYKLKRKPSKGQKFTFDLTPTKPLPGTTIKEGRPMDIGIISSNIKIGKTFYDGERTWQEAGSNKSNEDWWKALKNTTVDFYRDRVRNVHGEKMRFIVLDSGFTEGLSLFNVRHFWFLEAPDKHMTLDQAIGRAARLCGSTQLDFNTWEGGWPLYVHMLYHYVPLSVPYKSRFCPKDIKEEKKQKLVELTITDKQRKTTRAIEQLEALFKNNAVDHYLFENVNTAPADSAANPVKFFSDNLCLA